MTSRPQTGGSKQNLPADTEAAPPENSASTEHGKVLVVEDEPEILEPLAYSLQMSGFKVLRAEDGLTACRIIGSEQPDLILLDIMLPDLNGWEVCRMLRQHPDSVIASTPVIMLTALSAPEDKYRGLEIGADLYLPKPYSIREVILLSGKLAKARRKTLSMETRLARLASQEQQVQGMHHLLFHELRNQLMILTGFSRILHRDPEGKHAETCRDAIFRSSNYLQNLAEEALLIRQLEDGELALQAEDLVVDEVIAEVVSVYTTPARNKRVQLRHVIESRQQPVRLNRPSLKIILSSLIDNGIKYGPSGQTITISGRQAGDTTEIMVTDQGPGISLQDQDRIFDPYVRLQQQEITKGSGLGLYAVRTLAKAMGGDVHIESLPGHGSTFRICLPNVS